MNQAEIDTLCEALCLVFDWANGGFDNSRGICHLFGGALHDLGVPFDKLYSGLYWEWLDATMRAWPEYSGNTAYPVPLLGARSGTPQRTAAHAYWAAQEDDLMWCTRREYGKARWRLLAFLLNAASKLKP